MSQNEINLVYNIRKKRSELEHGDSEISLDEKDLIKLGNIVEKLIEARIKN